MPIRWIPSVVIAAQAPLRKEAAGDHPAPRLPSLEVGAATVTTSQRPGTPVAAADSAGTAPGPSSASLHVHFGGRKETYLN